VPPWSPWRNATAWRPRPCNRSSLTAQQAARELDPLLIIAVIGIESGFNPFAQSVMGAQGLMQVIPRFHRDKLPPETPPTAFLDPVSNVRVGAQVLHEAIRRQGGLIEGLQYYAGAADDPERGYAARVIAEKQRLELAVRLRKPNTTTLGSNASSAGHGATRGAQESRLTMYRLAGAILL
jgi:soluble lytic murein transglycosylase-like protein